MGVGDFFASAVILSGAVYLLYRSVWKKQGSCHGCTSGGCRPPPRAAELVRLGQPRGAAGVAPSAVRAEGQE